MYFTCTHPQLQSNPISADLYLLLCLLVINKKYGFIGKLVYYCKLRRLLGYNHCCYVHVLMFTYYVHCIMIFLNMYLSTCFMQKKKIFKLFNQLSLKIMVEIALNSPPPRHQCRPLSHYNRSSWVRIIVNLRNRTGEERRPQTLCDKRDNNFAWNNFSPNFTFF